MNPTQRAMKGAKIKIKKVEAISGNPSNQQYQQHQQQLKHKLESDSK